MKPWEVHQQDAVEWLRELETKSVDLIVTDPAYESLEKHRAKGTTTRLKVSKGSSNEWFPIFPNARFEELFAELYRVLKKDRHFYLMCDAETMFVAKGVGERAGFKFWKPLVWDKVSIGMGYHYRSRYEFILFFEKGKRKLADLGVPDIITCKRVRGYPTEKPVPVVEVLVKQSTQPGEIVIDPFVGSGTTGVAAIRNDRRFFGCDIQEKAVIHSQMRLKEAWSAPQNPLAQAQKMMKSSCYGKEALAALEAGIKSAKEKPAVSLGSFAKFAKSSQ